MDADAPQRLRARMEDLQVARALAEAVCARQGVAAGDTLRLVLVLEELFTNTVMHGHRRDCDAPVLIASNQKAYDVLGWVPVQSGLETIIASAWEWHCRMKTPASGASHTEKG